MPRIRRIAAAAALAAASLALAACGSSDDGLSRGQADELLASLASVRGEFEGGDPCGAADPVAQLREQVEGLGSEVDGELRNALSSGTESLASQLEAECVGEEPTTTATTTTSTTTSSTTETTDTTDTSETTDTTDTTETTDTTTTETNPPTGGGGGGGGGGVSPGSADGG